MTKGSEVTVAGKRYENAAAYIQSLMGSLRATQHGSNPVQVTVEPDEELDADDLDALR